MAPTTSTPSAAAAAAERAAALPPEFTPGSRAVSGRAGVVVAVEPLAARAGAKVLERGGNAVDAAIATVLALSVTHPNAASLGGGGFALVRRPRGPTVAVDFREVAPRALQRARFDRMIAEGARGPVAVGVPGTVAGLELLQREYGTMTFAELAEPAIVLARDGHLIAPWQARVLGWSYTALARDESARRIFGRNGKPLARGARLVQRDLASTLERIGRGGALEFYQGATAQKLATALAPHGPDLEDLRSYRAVLREPLRFAYRGYEVETMPPPSAGGVTLAGLLLGLAAAPASAGERDSAAEIHYFLELSRRAQAERRLAVVDPGALSDAEMTARLARWTDPRSWLAVPIGERATPSSAVRSLYGMDVRESEHTTHLSVADRSGLVVSLTTTLSASFGAKMVAPGTGIVLNNAVASFGSAGENQPVAGRRTTSSMAPTLLLRGDAVAAVLGTPGGDTIPSTLAQVVRNLVDEELPLDEAVRAARWHHGFIPDQARYEPAPSPDAALLAALRERGHRLLPFRRPIGDANCIVFQQGVAYGFADPRELGISAAAEAP